MKPQNFEERLVWYSILGTYVLYFLGLQLVWIPTVAWLLTLYLCKKLWQQTAITPEEEKIVIPASVWVWVFCMLIVELALSMACIDLNLGTTKIIASLRDWCFSWSLMALFPLVGCLKIRPQILYRAACLIGLQSFGFTLICYLLFLLHIPSIHYISPVWSLMHGSSELYTVELFVVDAGNEFRLNLFTATANSLGIAGSIYFFLACQESNKKWRWIGMVTTAAMVVGSASRMTTFCLVIVPILTWFLTNFTWIVQITTGVVIFVVSIFSSQLIEVIQNAWDKAIKGYRSGSEVVRSRLKAIALERWQETPIWGHGPVLEKGPKTTEFIPIGTHNQWPDLLYNSGLVGATAFFIPWLWSFIDLLIEAQNSKVGKGALSIVISLLISTAGGDIQAAAYLYYPGLVLMGIAFKEKVIPSSESNVYHLVDG